MVARVNPARVQPSPVRVWRLYRFYDAHGALLYIGQTCRPLARLIEHLEEQGWAHEVARWEVDPRTWSSEADVLAAETAAIRAERPRYNWAGNESNPDRVWVPKVRRYRHPWRRTAAHAPARRLLRSRWAWWLCAWTVFTAVLAVVDVAGQSLTLRQSASAVTAGMVGGWLWWRFDGRRRVRRWVRRLIPRRTGR